MTVFILIVCPSHVPQPRFQHQVSAGSAAPLHPVLESWILTIWVISGFRTMPDDLFKCLYLMRFCARAFNTCIKTAQLTCINSGQPQCPWYHENEINLALSEAWGWLHAQGLIVSDMENGQYGWVQLSRRARHGNRIGFREFQSCQSPP